MSAKQSSCFARIALTLVRGYFHLQHGQRGSDRLPVELPWPEMGWISLARGRGGIAARGELRALNVTPWPSFLVLGRHTALRRR